MCFQSQSLDPALTLRVLLVSMEIRGEALNNPDQLVYVLSQLTNVPPQLLDIERAQELLCQGETAHSACLEVLKRYTHP